MTEANNGAPAAAEPEAVPAAGPHKSGLKARTELGLYRLGARLAGLYLPRLLKRRVARGKEDADRLGERRGIASLERTEGQLVWIHAASNGEALSVEPLIRQFKEARPELTILITTGTVTSADLVAARLADLAIHQFVPLDHPAYCKRFLAHWQPDLAIWVESELWPNLISMAHARGVPLALVNARLSEKSARNWQRAKSMAADLLGRFSVVMAQDKETATRLTALGARHVENVGNLKHDGGVLPATAEGLATLQYMTRDRPLWLATNTHEGEEAIAAEGHRRLKPDFPDLLTMIVPRHPSRGPDIAKALEAEGLKVARRAGRTKLADSTDIYLADTTGELGIFYRVAEIVFVGGTLNPQGGHNPFEPARLSCALIAGPSRENLAESFALFEDGKALSNVTDADSLAAAVHHLLDDEPACGRQAKAAKQIAESARGAAGRVSAALLPLLKDTLVPAHDDNAGDKAPRSA